MKKYIFLLILTSSMYSQTVNRYTIHVEFFPEDAQIRGQKIEPDNFMRGRSIVDFIEPVSDIEFYLHGELRVDSIMYADNKIEYKSEKVEYYYDYSLVANKITASIDLKYQDALQIYYSGFMHPSRVRSLSDYMRIDINKGVFLRSYGYSLWFPIFMKARQDDYKVDFKKVTVNLPEKFKGIVLGELIKEKTDKGRYTAEWKPGVEYISYLQCTAQLYNTLSKKEVSVYYTESEEYSKDVLEFTLKVKQLFSKYLIQNIESPVYVMGMPKYGEISSGTVVGIPESEFQYFNENVHLKETIIHELLHPYVRIPVSKDNPFYALVIEGFPDFFKIWGLKNMLKGNEYDLNEVMMEVEKKYLQKKATGQNSKGRALPKEKPILEIGPEEIGYYKDTFILNDRVRLFLYHFWRSTGDADFNRFIKELFKLSHVDYQIFEKLILTYQPDYKEALNIWLNTNDYPNSFRLKS